LAKSQNVAQWCKTETDISTVRKYSPLSWTTNNICLSYHKLKKGLHYIRKLIYRGLGKGNFKDYYGNVVIKQCLGKIAEINEFSAFDKMF